MKIVTEAKVEDAVLPDLQFKCTYPMGIDVGTDGFSTDDIALSGKIFIKFTHFGF